MYFCTRSSVLKYVRTRTYQQLLTRGPTHVLVVLGVRGTTSTEANLVALALLALRSWPGVGTSLYLGATSAMAALISAGGGWGLRALQGG